jgi:hypothetical protein
MREKLFGFYLVLHVLKQSPDRRTNFQPGPKPGHEPGPVLLLCFNVLTLSNKN